MEIRELTASDQVTYEKIAGHPLQSWVWGQFREKTGVRVVRVGLFDGEQLRAGFQITLHPIPYTQFFVGYFPKGELPNREMISALTDVGQKYNCIFIQLEPAVILASEEQARPESASVTDPGQARMTNLVPSSRPLFTKYTFHIDLTKSEEELMQKFSGKTRYNIRVAQKHGVIIQEENSEEAFTRYLELTNETTQRQGFYAHNDDYHRLMWQTLAPNGIAHMLTARYQGKILVTWILFLFKDILYYPYGASSTEHKEVMASNLMMWEAIRWGKARGAKLFDLWGTPGPDPRPTDSYYGFHKFKLGYSPKLVEFVGSYDLVLKQPHYLLFAAADKVRWFFLRLKSKFKNQNEK